VQNRHGRCGCAAASQRRLRSSRDAARALRGTRLEPLDAVAPRRARLGPKTRGSRRLAQRWRHDVADGRRSRRRRARSRASAVMSESLGIRRDRECRPFADLVAAARLRE